MDSRRLKLQQVAQLQAAIGKQLQYVNRLCERMEKLGFPSDDPLNREAMRARKALRELDDTARRLCRQARRMRGQP